MDGQAKVAPIRVPAPLEFGSTDGSVSGVGSPGGVGGAGSPGGVGGAESPGRCQRGCWPRALITPIMRSSA